MKNFLIRTLTGAIFVASIIGSIFLGASYYAGLMSVFVVVGSLEFYRMFDKEKPISIQKYFGLFAAVYVFLLIFLMGAGYISSKGLLTLVPLFFLGFIIEIYRKTETPIHNIAFSLFPIFYIALPLSLSTYLIYVSGNETPYILLGFFILVWSNDTFAYLTGVTLGRHRLLERISPKKSWEGFFGGLFFSLGIAFLLGRFFHELEIYQWMIVALIITITGTYGDLVESMFKRSRNIKDSGNILPGHGGVLDRFDGVIMAAPFIVLYVYLFL